jgi:group I intron endonuclease
MAYIYKLIDPETNEVRYIGKTTRTLKKRYKEHLTDTRYSTHKVNWISKLKMNDKLPIIELIEECDDNISSEREKYWITQFENLTNSTDGGEDGKHTEETKAKLREINKGKNNPCYLKVWTDEERKRLSEARKKVILTEEWKDNIGKTLGFGCIINDVEYRSIKQAGIELGVSSEYIKRRILSDDYPEYRFK